HHRLRRIAPATCPLHALRAQLQELHGFVVQTLPLVAIPERFTNDAPGDAWAEIVLIIKAAHSGHHLRLGQVRILDMRKLVAAVIGESFDAQKTLLSHGVVKFGAGHGVGQRNLDGFAIEFFGKFDGVLDGLFGFAGKTDDEVAVNANADLAAILHESAAHFHGRALLNVLENLSIAGFEANDEQASTAIRHGLQRFIIAVDARRGGPLELQGFELGAEFHDAVLADVEGVVVEENLL